METETQALVEEVRERERERSSSAACAGNAQARYCEHLEHTNSTTAADAPHLQVDLRVDRQLRRGDFDLLHPEIDAAEMRGGPLSSRARARTHTHTHTLLSSTCQTPRTTDASGS